MLLFGAGSWEPKPEPVAGTGAGQDKTGSTTLQSQSMTPQSKKKCFFYKWMLHLHKLLDIVFFHD